MVNMPRFISLEGIDGAGTTHHAKTLKSYLESIVGEGEVILTHEPWEGSGNKPTQNFLAIKQHLENDLDPYTHKENLFRYFLDNGISHNNDLIRPALENDKYLITDRHRLSLHAYQKSQGISPEEILREQERYKILMPDLTIWLDLPVPLAIERINLRGEPLEKFENKEFLEKVSSQYKIIYQMSEGKMKDDFGTIIKIIKVSSSGTKEETQDQIRKAILNWAA